MVIAISNDHIRKKSKLENLHVNNIRPLTPPSCILEEYPITQNVYDTVSKTRKDISNILHGKDDRLVVIVGPCSIHDVNAAKEYGLKLKNISLKLQNDLVIVMRTYFEKPRTTVGWKGLINDPDLNQSFNINKGLRIARELLLELNEMNVPVSLEFLDTISPQFTADLISWGAIGARTTESQLHRELASGLSMPVGFKNGTGGNLKIAVDAAISASCGHNFLGVNEQGLASIVNTSGNKDCHLILRGGSSGPNYEEKYIDESSLLLKKHNLPDKIMIDCSHGNSNKKHENQPKVADYLCSLIANGKESIMGLMIESNIVEGNQALGSDVSKLVYGQSITDACISWETTVTVLNNLAKAVQERRNKLKGPEQNS